MIFRSRTEILLPDKVKSCVVGDGWDDYDHGEPLTADELENIENGNMPELVVDYVDGFAITLRLQPESRPEAPFDDKPTALFSLRLDADVAEDLATALIGAAQAWRRVVKSAQEARREFEEEKRR
jgi:hypothetical protein